MTIPEYAALDLIDKGGGKIGLKETCEIIIAAGSDFEPALRPSRPCLLRSGYKSQSLPLQPLSAL